jgi:hypothetical protein
MRILIGLDEKALKEALKNGGPVVVVDTAETPVSLVITEGEIEDISSMKGQKDDQENPIDTYNLFPESMSEKEFNQIMKETKK